MVDLWLHDLRYAARLLRRQPLFALTAAVSLAIAIGANTTIFAVANALLFRRAAGVADPSRLVDVGRSQNGQGFDNNSYPNYLDIRARNSVFTDIYAYRLGPEAISLGGRDGAERIYGNVATTNYFTVLGVRAAAGRLFEPGDGDQPGATPLVVLSYRFWTRRFGGDPAVVGTTLVLNGHPFTVVGVAAEGFQGTTILGGDVWLPLNMVGEVSPRRDSSLLTNRLAVWLVMGARLKPGVSLEQARTELAAIGAALEREYPDQNRGRGLRVVPSSPIPGNGAPVAAFMALLLAIAGAVLAIAAANVAGVLLARAAARRREIAVRRALGAGRTRLVRQLLVESVLLFAVGAVAGLALARVATTLIMASVPALPVPVDVSLSLDGRSFAFTVAVALATSVLAGIVPALHAANGDVVGGLKYGVQGTPERQRLRHAFVVGQVACSLVLIVAAGLFGRALQRAAEIDPGFDIRGVEIAALDLSLAGYTADTARPFARMLVDRIRAHAGVQSAALTAAVPLGGSGLGLGALSLPGEAEAPGPHRSDVDWNIVTPGYFATMKMRLVGGRDFTDADREDTPPVVIVNETAAQLFWSTPRAADVIGRTLVQRTAPRGTPNATRLLTVIGVAANSRYRSLGEDRRPFVYVPLDQQYMPRTAIVARSPGTRRLTADIKAIVAAMNPNLPIVSSQTLEEYAALGLIPQRVAAAISGSLGLVGLLLAVIGIYGVTACMATSRTREFGIRMALGAQRGAVMRMVLGQGLMLTLAGAAIGLALAAAAGRLLQAWLFGVSGADPITFAGSALLFCAIGLAACYAPARRATTIEASEALRAE